MIHAQLHAEYAPHISCYLWDWRLVLLQGTSDLLTAFVYVLAIPLTGLYVYRVGELSGIRTAFPTLWRLGLWFVLLCGISHLGAVLEIFLPIYWATGIERSAMAIVSSWFAWRFYVVRNDLAVIGRVFAEIARQRAQQERLPR